MPTFVALLRGVNVGKSRRIPMAAFRALLSGLGYTRVATLLNSGNAVFGAPKLAAATHAGKIAHALRDELKVDVPVVVKSASELDAIVAENPIRVEAGEHARLLVAFTQDRRTLTRLAPIEALALPQERFAIGKHAAYLHCAAGILQSKAGEALLGRAGSVVTTRSWATTLRLHALAGGVDA